MKIILNTLKNSLKHVKPVIKSTAGLVGTSLVWIGLDKYFQNLFSTDRKIMGQVNDKWQTKYNKWLERNKDKPKEVIEATRQQYLNNAKSEFEYLKAREETIKQAASDYYDQLHENLK